MRGIFCFVHVGGTTRQQQNKPKSHAAHNLQCTTELLCCCSEMDLFCRRMDIVNCQVSLWKARKELAAVISETAHIQSHTAGPLTLRSAGTRCLRLLRRHPCLSQERFHRILAYKLYPLSFLLQIGADKAIIESVYNMNRKVLSQKVYNQVGKCEPDGYPLHLACESQLSEDVILFLARGCPEAAQKKNASGELPIHVLLRNRRHIASVNEVRALLDAGGDEIMTCIPSLLNLAFENTRINEEGVLEVLVERFRKDCNTLHLGGVADYVDEIKYRYIKHQGKGVVMTCLGVSALGKLMPRLGTLSCVASHWRSAAFRTFVERLQEQEKLTDLTLHLPSCLLRSKDIRHLDLRAVLSKTKTLRRLHIDFDAYHVEARNVQLNDAVAKRIEGILASLLGGLSCNHSLKECHLTGGLVNLSELTFFREKFWPSLARILRDSNTTLESMSAPNVDQIHDVNSKEMQEVRHLMELNHFGRSRVRNQNPCNATFASLLDQVNAATQDQSVDKLSTLFGLLQECPGQWS